MNPKPSYQESLLMFGLATLRGQTEDSLRKIYYQLAQTHHPDKGGSAQAFIRLREAFSLLKRALNEPPEMDPEEPFTYYRTAVEEGADGGTRPEENGDRQGREGVWRVRAMEYEAAFRRVSAVADRYEDVFNSQIQIAEILRTRVNTVIEAHGRERTNLDNWLNSELEKLNRAYHKKWWQKILPGPKMTAEEYVYWHNELVRHYNNIGREIEEDFSRMLIQEYQEGVRAILDLLEL